MDRLHSQAIYIGQPLFSGQQFAGLFHIVHYHRLQFQPGFGVDFYNQYDNPPADVLHYSTYCFGIYSSHPPLVKIT